MCSLMARKSPYVAVATCAHYMKAMCFASRLFDEGLIAASLWPFFDSLMILFGENEGFL